MSWFLSASLDDAEGAAFFSSSSLADAAVFNLDYVAGIPRPLPAEAEAAPPILLAPPIPVPLPAVGAAVDSVPGLLVGEVLFAAAVDAVVL